MRVITVKKRGFEFLILPINHSHPKYREGDRFELYLKDGTNYIGMNTYAVTTYLMQGKIDIIIDMMEQAKGIDNEYRKGNY